MLTYPYTIDNGHGEQITFLGRTTRENQPCLEVENCISPGNGPPMHAHFRQQESITVREGRMGMQIAGDAHRFLQAGETAHFSKGVSHRFWNAGETMLCCQGQVWPADNFEYFITEIYRSAKASKQGRPAAFDSAYLLERYKAEFHMADIPVLVKKLVFPLVIFTGRLMGKHKKYRQAPSPLQ